MMEVCMSISPLRDCSISDEEVDSKGNLKGFVVDSEEEQVIQSSRRKRHRKAPKEPDSAKKRKRAIAEEEEFSSIFFHKTLFHEMHSALDIIHPSKIFGREREAMAIAGMVSQPQGGIRPLLLGPSGVGKYSTVKKTAMLIQTELKKHPLGNKKIYCLDCKELIADSLGENLVQAVGGKLQNLIETSCRMEVSSPIFYFRHVEALLHLDQVSEYLQSLLKRPCSFIASISEEVSNDKVIKAMEILSRYNFSPMPIEESPQEAVEEIVENHLNKHRLHPNVFYTKEGINLAVRLAGKYRHTTPFPSCAINLIQECANACLIHQKVEGKLTITPKEIAEFVSQKTKVPAADLLDDSIFNQERFIEKLKNRVVGQDYALGLVSDRVAVYKMKLADTTKPWGVFLFVGPTGVGKTELAKSLAKYLFEEEANLITINGSEYIEDHSISNLIGSPKGYEGNESGGLLTEALKKNPHQVVLLDEFEKAHRNVQRLFLQVFDSGFLVDRKGERVECSQALFIMTSNVGSELLFDEASKGELGLKDVIASLIPLLKEAFSPELVGRFERGIVPFRTLTRDLMPAVAAVKLSSIKERLLREAEIDLSWTPSLIRHFSDAKVDVRFGMRVFCNMIDETVVSLIKDAMIQSKKRITGKLELTYDKGESQFKMTVKR